MRHPSRYLAIPTLCMLASFPIGLAAQRLDSWTLRADVGAYAVDSNHGLALGAHVGRRLLSGLLLSVGVVRGFGADFTDLEGGLELHFLPRGRVDPLVGLGFGYEDGAETDWILAFVVFAVEFEASPHNRVRAGVQRGSRNSIDGGMAGPHFISIGWTRSF